MPKGMATASSAGRHEAGEWFTHGRQAARSAGSAPLIRLAAHASDRLPRRHESPESIPPARRRAEPSAARLWGRLRDARGVGEHQARRGRPWRPRRRPRRPRRRRWRAGRVWSSLVFAGRSGLALRREVFAGSSVRSCLDANSALHRRRNARFLARIYFLAAATVAAARRNCSS